MRRFLPFALAGMLACGASPERDGVYVRRFVERSARVRCEPAAPAARGTHVGELSTIGDSALLALFPRERMLVLYDAQLDTLRTLRFSRAVQDPESAALLGNAQFYVADRRGRALHTFGVDGAAGRVIALDVVPLRLRGSPRGLLVGTLLFGAYDRELVHLLRDTVLEAQPVPILPVTDPMIQALANLVWLEVWPSGRTLVAHQFLYPVAHILDAQGKLLGRWSVPLPAEVRNAVGRPPRLPLTDDALERVATPVLAAAVDHATGDLLYLTRSGRRRAGGFEKAIVRADSLLAYRRSYLLDVNALHLAYVPRDRAAIVVDRQDRWYRCPIP